MTQEARTRTLAELIAAEAPIATRRSIALVSALAHELKELEPARRQDFVGADQIVLAEDGSVEILVPVTDAGAAESPPPGDVAEESEATNSAAHTDGSQRAGQFDYGTTEADAAGATVGRLWFELLIGRPPLGSQDAYEPALISTLEPAQRSLIARSCSSSPGQWPRLRDWTTELDRAAGGQALPPPPARRAAARRRAIVAFVALIVLVVTTIAVLVLAPGWWDGATEDGSSTVQPEHPAQSWRTSS